MHNYAAIYSANYVNGNQGRSKTGTLKAYKNYRCYGLYQTKVLLQNFCATIFKLMLGFDINRDLMYKVKVSVSKSLIFYSKDSFLLVIVL